jgi:hypothetical protein
MLHSILILIIFICCSTISTAQDTSEVQEPKGIRDWIGITGGLSLPYYSGFPASRSWSDESLAFQKDKLSGYHIGITWQRTYGFGSTQITRLNYSYVPGTFADSGTTTSHAPYDSSYTFLRQYGRVYIWLINAEHLYSIEFADRWHIALGPTLGLYLSSSYYEQTLTIEHPKSARFVTSGRQYRDSGKTEVLLDERSPQFKTRIGVKIGVQYEVPLGSRITLLPELAVDLAMNDITSDFDWQLHIMRFGLVIQYEL